MLIYVYSTNVGKFQLLNIFFVAPDSYVSQREWPRGQTHFFLRFKWCLLIGCVYFLLFYPHPIIQTHLFYNKTIFTKIKLYQNSKFFLIYKYRLLSFRLDTEKTSFFTIINYFNVLNFFFVKWIQIIILSTTKTLLIFLLTSKITTIINFKTKLPTIPKIYQIMGFHQISSCCHLFRIILQITDQWCNIFIKHLLFLLLQRVMKMFWEQLNFPKNMYVL